MMNGFVSSGPMLWGGLGMILVWALVLMGAVWLVIGLARETTSATPAMLSPLSHSQAPREILEERLARRGITPEEYARMKRDLDA